MAVLLRKTHNLGKSAALLPSLFCIPPEMGSRLVLNAKKNETNNMKLTCATQTQLSHAEQELCATALHWGLR